MSFWARVKSAFGARPAPSPEGDAAQGNPPAALRPEPLRVPAAEPLERMVRGDEPFDEARAVDALARALAGPDALDALARARRLLADAPASARLRLATARAYDQRGDADAALSVLAPALAKDAAFVEHALAGEIHERRGEHAEAVRAYERALSLDVTNAGVRDRLAALRPADREAPQASLGTLATEGATAGRYRIERQIGRGGAGTVFAARDVELGRRVAVKLYHRRGPAERARILAEARTAASLEHPGVVRVFDLDLDLFAVALEWLPGGSVKERLERGRLGRAEALVTMHGVTRAVAFVHAHGLVHRDLKPSNFLLRDDGRPVLTDFGLCLERGAPPARPGEGSMGYMPREQREGAPADPRSDVHALGVSFREMWPAAEPLPEPLDTLLRAATADRPDARPALSAIEAALGAALAEDPPSR